MYRKRYIGNTVFLLLTSMVGQIINLLVLPLFIENLGPGMYGLFVITNMLVGYVGLLDFGFTDGLVRYIAQAYAKKDHQKLNEVVATGGWLLFLIGLISGSAIFFGRNLFIDFLNITGDDRGIASNLLVVTALFSLIQWPMRLPGCILQAALRLKEEGIVVAAQTIITSLLMLGLVYFHFDVVSIRIGSFLVIILSWFPLFFLVSRFIPDLKFKIFEFKILTLREVSSFSLGMFYTKLLSMLAVRIDTLIIGKMISIGAIAPYVIAAKLSEVINTYSGKLAGAFLPTVFNLDTNENRSKLQTLLNDGVRYRALLITPLAYLGIVISPSFIRTWMGPEYVQYAIWSQLFMAAHIANIFGVAVNIARGTGKLNFANRLLTVRVLVNVIISIALVPYYGIGGPVIGTVIASTLLGDVIVFPFFCRICNLYWKEALKDGIVIILSSVPIALISYVVLQGINISTWGSLLPVTAVIFFLFYINLFVVFFKEKEKQDIFSAFESMGITRIRSIGVLLRKILL